MQAGVRSETRVFIPNTISHQGHHFYSFVFHSWHSRTRFYQIVSLRHFRLEISVEAENFDAALVNLVANNVFLTRVVQIHVMDHTMVF